MALALTLATLQALSSGFKALVDVSRAAATDTSSIVKAWAMPCPTTAGSVTIPWLDDVGKVKRWINEREVAKARTLGAKFEVFDWDETWEIPRNVLEDDQAGTYNGRAQMSGAAIAAAPGEICAQRLVDGFTTKTWTGKYVFDTNHDPAGNGNKFTNLGTAALTAASFEAAYNLHVSRLNSSGKSWGLGRKPALVVAPGNQINANDIVGSRLGTGGQTNKLADLATVKVLPELAALMPTAWFLVEENHPLKPFVNVTRKDWVWTDLIDPRDPNVFFHKTYVFGYDARFNWDILFPQLITGYTGLA